MRKKRRFYRGVVNHIYQKTSSGDNLFYDYEDYLAFYTIFAVCARSMNIITLELSLMRNHFHGLAITESAEELSSFMERCCSWYARESNIVIGRKGRLFKKNFGSAPKWDEKSIRSAINYVGNNPVEKGICKTAEECRWTFLAYYENRHPFSEPIILDKASKPLRRAVKEVKAMAALNLPLKHQQLSRMMKKLSPQEKEQLVDYIISEYLPFDYQKLISYYGLYEAMLTAMNSNTGSEHEINEEWYPESDLAYSEMIEFVKKERPENMVRSVITLPLEDKHKLAAKLRCHTSGSDRQICRFLHMPHKKPGE